MTRIIGIDPSSKKLAFCLTDGRSNVLTMYTVNLPEGVLQASGVAFGEVFSFLWPISDSDEGIDTHIYMEAPVVGRNAYSTIVQAQVGGAVMAAIAKTNLGLELVNVSSWKKQVVGKGNATKEEVADWLKTNWLDAYNKAAGDQDLIDAAAINRYAHQHVRLAKAIIKRSKRGNHQGEKAAA